MSKMLKSIVDEVYDYPALLPEVYAAFRFEHCFVSQQHAEQVAAMKFADAYPLLKKCEQIDPQGSTALCNAGSAYVDRHSRVIPLISLPKESLHVKAISQY
nr:hypothetical protein [Pseudomonas sp. BIGb0427]